MRSLSWEWLVLLRAPETSCQFSTASPLYCIGCTVVKSVTARRPRGPHRVSDLASAHQVRWLAVVQAKVWAKRLRCRLAMPVDPIPIHNSLVLALSLRLTLFEGLAAACCCGFPGRRNGRGRPCSVSGMPVRNGYLTFVAQTFTLILWVCVVNSQHGQAPPVVSCSLGPHAACGQTLRERRQRSWF